MHACEHCGDEHEAVDDLRSHVQDHDLHWHHCEACGADLMDEMEDVSPSAHRAAIDRIRREHVAERDDAVHLN